MGQIMCVLGGEGFSSQLLLKSGENDKRPCHDSNELSTGSLHLAGEPGKNSKNPSRQRSF